MKIAISGASGFIGGYLQNFLIGAGHDLIFLQRSSSQSDGIEVVNFDLDNFDTFNQQKLKDVDVVVHLAACVHNFTADLGDHMRRNFKATEALYYASAAAHVKKFIFVSTVGVYGKDHSDFKLYVNSPTDPQSPYALSKLEAERFLLSQLNNGPIISIVRLPLIYGPNAPGNVMLLSKLIKTFKIMPFAGFQNKRSIIKVCSVCNILKQMCEDLNLHSGLHLLAEKIPISTQQLIEYITNDSSLYVRCIPVPKLLIKTVLFTIQKKSIFEKICGDLVFESTIKL